MATLVGEEKREEKEVVPGVRLENMICLSWCANLRSSRSSSRWSQSFQAEAQIASLHHQTLPAKGLDGKNFFAQVLHCKKHQQHGENAKERRGTTAKTVVIRDEEDEGSSNYFVRGLLR